jgi:hypothetical protein
MGMIGNSLAQGLISGANIQDGTVDTPDIKDSAVTAAKIASGVVTPAKMDFSAGTANGVLYLNGSKVASSGSALVFDGTNLGIGVSSPTLKLSVAGGLNVTSGNQIVAGSSSAYSDGTIGTPSFQFNAFSGAASGAVGIANTTTNIGQIYFRNPNGFVGNISTSGSNTTYTTTSDYRLKENIAPMAGALAVVQQLKPCTYNWKVDGSSGQGFIAHELQEVVPDCVSGEKDGIDADGNPRHQSIDTSFLVATLTAAIQEQQAIIESLTQRITALETP